MRTKVQKWGNSLALRIPKAFAQEVKLENDTIVDITIQEGQIILKPLVSPRWELDELLAGINKKNIHREIDAGYSIGNEIW
ncbi:MAG: AbrB/MazE/SpoVT family DNA-binding domain-containing protein [Saprospiraceae bacterium]|nr:AbrB/MazE/SpoVT family DNA-binding domain-containing protein [Saprospiraceae bacterium]